MKKNTFDLSKIGFRETPEKEILAKFGDTEETYTIRALGDSSRLDFISILSNQNDVSRIRKMYVLLLSEGLGIEQNVAEFLYANCNAEAVRVADAVYEFSNLFNEAKNEEAANAEKN